MIHSEINSQLDKIKEILINNRVVKAYLYGSVCTPGFNKNSDIDIMVDIDNSLPVKEYSDCFWNIQFALEDMLHRKIDLITENSVTNPYFKQEVEKSRVSII